MYKDKYFLRLWDCGWMFIWVFDIEAYFFDGTGIQYRTITSTHTAFDKHLCVLYICKLIYHNSTSLYPNWLEQRGMETSNCS